MSINDKIPDNLKPLLPMEAMLLETITKGEICRPDPEMTYPEVRGELIRWLCIDSEMSKEVHSEGIQIEQANIAGKLHLANCDVNFPVRLIDCDFEQPIDFSGARVSSVKLNKSRTKGVNAERLINKYSFFMAEDFSADGEVDLQGATIEGDLDCSSGYFRNPEGVSIKADNIKIRGYLYLNKAYSTGTIRLSGATIGANLECEKAHFRNSSGPTVIADNLRVNGSVFLRYEFYSKGELLFLGAKIDGTLDCESGFFENRNGYSFLGDGMKVEGAILLRKDFLSEGEVKLYGVEAGELDCMDGIFNASSSGICFNGAYMSIKKAFKWGGSTKGRIILRNAKVSILDDYASSWPQEAGNLDLDGFEYDSIPFDYRANAEERLRWLSLQFPPMDWFEAVLLGIIRIENFFIRDPEKRKRTFYRPEPSIQPYEQLSAVFRKMGLPDEAKAVQIAKNKFIVRRSTGLSKLWRWFKGVTIDFGYGSYKVFLPILLFMLLGFFVFEEAAKQGVMTPTSGLVTITDEWVGDITYPYPQFDPLLYSVDVFLPIVDLHQESYWIPNTRQPGGDFFMDYMMIHIMAGWFLTTLFVASVTGLVKNE